MAELTTAEIDRIEINSPNNPVVHVLVNSLRQAREDRAQAERAMRAAYELLKFESHIDPEGMHLMDTVALKSAMLALETALHITAGYWPR